MKHFYLLLFLCSTLSWSQVTIFSENMGTASGTLSIEANVFENSVVTFSGNADTRSTGSSDGMYTGASGGRNVFFGTGSSINNREFLISGINTENFTNVQLSFGMNSSSNLSLVVEYSTDGVAFTEITYPAVEAAGWKLITITDVTLPSVASLTLRFSKDDGTTYRVDDVLLTGNATVPILTTSTGSLTGMSYIVDAGPSAPESFSLSGANLNGNDVTASLPDGSNFEVSGSAGGTYGTSLTLTAFDGSATDIFVRLKNGLIVGNYSDVVTISGGGSDPTTADIAGDVVEKIFLIYEFTGNTVVPTQAPDDAVTSDFQVSIDGPPGFGTAQAETWTGSGIPYASSQTGWGATSVADAKYFFFNVTTDGNFLINAENISFEYRSTNTGPSAITVEINGDEIATFDVPANTTSIFTSPINYENLTALEVRIYGWDNGSRDPVGGGFFRIDDVRVDGETGQFLSVNDFNNNKGITLYPNPASNGDITILTDFAGTKHIEIYDINGRKVLKTSTTGDRINVDGFHSGLYLVKISIDEVSKVSKLIIN